MQHIPKAEFPRPDRQRSNWMNLNGYWEFALFAGGMEAQESAFAQSRKSYDRSINVPFSWACPLSGVNENVSGIGWYHRTVSFAAEGYIYLCFGAVDYKADVYVNGLPAGNHQGGYTPFEMDVTSFWREGENVIEVRAEDYRCETQTYGKQGYGEIQGIWQTVWLEARPEAFINSFRFLTRCSGEITLVADVSAPDGATLCASFDGRAWTTDIRGGTASISFTLENPKLWAPDHPYLYEGELSLEFNGFTDTVSTYFGVREITTAAVDGRSYCWIMLNGKPIYLSGTLDQAFNPQGYFTYPSDDDMRAEAWRLKRIGLNMVRIHVKAEEPRKLYWMDKLGVLVMADIPCFWGESIDAAQNAYEREWPDIIMRDINHPSVFSWVLFNECWGLENKVDGKWIYLPKTQDWVSSIYKRAKSLDATRIVEDNSPCCRDHVISDINTWHFYRNGYEIVRDHIREVVEKTYPGSAFNYISGFVQTDAPLMNSECGMVWGVDGSAGDSDLAWQYHYMLNEYRLHEKICGFVFTEFHDVVNEFNGYYRINDADKDFGYQDFCHGMSLRDLHAADFIATDCAPCRSIGEGELAEVPLVLSSFSNAYHREGLLLAWELWHDGLDGRISDSIGCLEIPPFDYGATVLPTLTLHMPDENAVAILSLYLKNKAGRIISRNFTTFSIHAVLPEGQYEIPVADGMVRGFEPAWQTLDGEKLCLGGAGEVSYSVRLPEQCQPSALTLFFEAGSKRVLKKDMKEVGKVEAGADFMRGYLVDRGAFENSYFMTDEESWRSEAEVLINGHPIATMALENDYADARGVLSWHMQPNPRKLDGAGSYGFRYRVNLPSRLLPGITQRGTFMLTFRVKGKGGLALYGRNFGRYPHGLLLRIE